MSAAPDFDPEYGSAAEWAREYRRLELQIVPCYAPSEVGKGKPWKRPRFHEWTEFQEALVADVVFDRWYGPEGEYIARINMGVITGRASGNLFVIDLDVHKNPAALDWWLGLLAVHNNSMELETAGQRTGGGGIQKLFRASAGWHCPTNRTPLGVDIRGQGGFAVLAPSLHESGRSYEWMPGRAPWDEVGIAAAPPWLLDEVTALVAAHGGDSSPNPKTRTASPNGDFDAFGHQHDGREWKMTRLICGAVVDWYRECPIKAGEVDQRAKAQEKYLIYESLVVSRLTDPSKTKADFL
jgi:Bifunctional DNA primase/polymerase, N-terminal